jgi:hypothetical protein
LNHCTTSDCQPFDNPGKLGAANWNDGKLIHCRSRHPTRMREQPGGRWPPGLYASLGNRPFRPATRNRGLTQ